VTQERRAPAEPPIPFDRPVKRELEKGDNLVYKLRNNPADPTSGGYDLTIAYFRDGTPEQFLSIIRVSRLLDHRQRSSPSTQKGPSHAGTNRTHQSKGMKTIHRARQLLLRYVDPPLRRLAPLSRLLSKRQSLDLDRR
jgi:hypothetical protein